MTARLTRLLVALGLVAAAIIPAACKKTPTNPSPVEATETFTGTITPGGAAFHQFTVSYTYYFTDAAFTVTALKSAADGSDKAITIGVGYGSIQVGVCQRIPSVSNPVVTVNTEIPTQFGTFGAGTYCIEVFDNPAAPTVTEPLTYSMKLRHF